MQATFEIKTVNSIPTANDKPAADVIKCAHVGAGGESAPDGYSELRMKIEDPELVGTLKVGMRLRVDVTIA